MRSLVIDRAVIGAGSLRVLTESVAAARTGASGAVAMLRQVHKDHNARSPARRTTEPALRKRDGSDHTARVGGQAGRASADG